MDYETLSQPIHFFRELKVGSLIAMLTPIIEQRAFSNDEHQVDPFEFFGRRIANYQFKVRHVPYKKENGLTTTHIPFVVKSSAIILVCDSIQDYMQRLQEVRTISAEIPIVVLATFSPRSQQITISGCVRTLYIEKICKKKLEAILVALFERVKVDNDEALH